MKKINRTLQEKLSLGFLLKKIRHQREIYHGSTGGIHLLTIAIDIISLITYIRQPKVNYYVAKSDKMVLVQRL